MRDSKAYAAAIAALPGVTPRRLVSLIYPWGPIVAWDMLRTGVHPSDPECRLQSLARERLVEQVEEACAANSIQVYLLGEEGYPRNLASDRGAPAVLFAKGNLGVLEASARVAMVGTRAATRAGESVAESLGRDLIEAGAVVISGMARGIDQAAHRGAIDALLDGSEENRASHGAGRGTVLAVPGSSLDRPPSYASELWPVVANLGLLLSEVPPLAPMTRWRFAVRNRIMAALADVVVVVECHESGGALHTVRAARLRGIPVGAVPGPLGSPASAGTNSLIAEGAFVVRDVADVMRALRTAALGLEKASRGGASLGSLRGDRGHGGRDHGARGDHRHGKNRLSGLQLPHSSAQDSDDPRPRTSRGKPGNARYLRGQAPARAKGRVPDGSKRRDRVLSLVEWVPTGVDDIVEQAGMAVGEVVFALEELRQAGLVREEAGWWSRC